MIQGIVEMNMGLQERLQRLEEGRGCLREPEARDNEEYEDVEENQQLYERVDGRRVVNNVAQQSISLPAFSGGDLENQETDVQDWFDQLDTLADLFQLNGREKRVVLISNLKGEALRMYRSADEQKRGSYTQLRTELLRQFQPVRIQAIQNNLFRQRVQRN